MLSRSLNPGSVPDDEWLRIAYLGVHALTQQCAQRASVVIGSVVEEDGLVELTYACAGQAGLAAAFRELRLASLFPPGAPQDEQDDNQCATLVAAVFGELVESPPQGESELRWNARKVAEWALLDIVFLLGSARLTHVGQLRSGWPGHIGY